jgi:CRP-like cAMP-binding protein
MSALMPNNHPSSVITGFDFYTSQDETSVLSGIFKPQTIRKDDFFIRQGDRPARIGYIVRGAFRSYIITEDGNDVTKYFYIEKSILFSYAAYIQKTESTSSIQALEDSEILTASMDDLEQALDSDPDLANLFKTKLDDVMIMKDRQASSFKLLNSADRYRQFLVDYPGLENRVKQYHLASYLGITPVSLSRIRKKLDLIK